MHCTVTRQQVRRDGYLEEFVRFWSENPDTRQIWVSLYTPQIGEVSDERLTPEDRRARGGRPDAPSTKFPKLRMPEGMIKVYAAPPSKPSECIFAQTTTCFSADFERQIAPCQFGGNPDCEQLRLHRFGWARRRLPPPVARRIAGRGHFRPVASHRARRPQDTDGPGLLI